MLIKVRVRTGARKESLREISPDHFEISVREEPEQNLANKRIIALVALHFNLPAAKIRITKGHHSASKILNLSSEQSKLAHFA